MAIGCALSPPPVYGETEISNLVCSGREPELSVPLARDDTGLRNNLPAAARVQLRYQFPTRPAIVNEAAPEIAMPASKRSICRRERCCGYLGGFESGCDLLHDLQRH
jgi:hypothetical protein